MIEIERHQLELPYAGLRVVERGQVGRLVASLSQHGQRSPVLASVTSSATRSVPWSLFRRALGSGLQAPGYRGAAL